jgi:lipopolysaccharide/colanic/teichoic acid biosynthesis glycosyltransferase
LGVIELLRTLLPLVIAGLLVTLIAEELKAWVPWLVDRLIKRALRGLPQSHCDRFDEEWRSHINDVPGSVGKMIAAFGLLRASAKMSRQLEDLGRLTSSRGEVQKRIFDLCFAVPYIVLLAPLLIVVRCILVLGNAGAPRICVGRHARNFSIPGFASRRSLRFQDAKTSSKKSALEFFCRVMRRVHIDSVLEIWPVLLGQMSLVGPRPVTPVRAERLSNQLSDYALRFAVKPGILSPAALTDIWLVEDARERARLQLEYDLDYVRHRTFWLDLKLMGSAIAFVMKDAILMAQGGTKDPPQDRA